MTHPMPDRPATGFLDVLWGILWAVSITLALSMFGYGCFLYLQNWRKY